MSEKHFIFDPARGRSVLRADSKKIRTHGKLYGLPKHYYDWLCGNEIDTSVFKGNGRDLVWIESRVLQAGLNKKEVTGRKGLEIDLKNKEGRLGAFRKEGICRVPSGSSLRLVD